MDGTVEATIGLGVALCHDDRSMTYGAADEVIPLEPHDSPAFFLATRPAHATPRDGGVYGGHVPAEGYATSAWQLVYMGALGCTQTALSYTGGRASPGAVTLLDSSPHFS